MRDLLGLTLILGTRARGGFSNPAELRHSGRHQGRVAASWKQLGATIGPWPVR